MLFWSICLFVRSSVRPSVLIVFVPWPMWQPVVVILLVVFVIVSVVAVRTWVIMYLEHAAHDSEDVETCC